MSRKNKSYRIPFRVIIAYCSLTAPPSIAGEESLNVSQVVTACKEHGKVIEQNLYDYY